MLRACRTFTSHIKPTRFGVSSRILANSFSNSATFQYDPAKIRNVAIIAHVDHGKTTLVDKLLEHCGDKVEERAMDSNEHEKERGITIMSKYARLYYKGHMLHVVDTPGHSDFGGEVERIMGMVDGVVLLVDASEGPMSQTKFVLSKALNANKKAIVVLNKVDRDGHRADVVESEIFDLFCNLSSNDSLLDFPVMYASGKQGWVAESMADVPGKDGVVPLLDKIISHIPPASSTITVDAPFGLSVNTIQTDDHLGRIVTGKVESGSISLGDSIKVMSRKGDALFSDQSFKVTKLFYLEGLNRVDVNKANAGEIVSLAGCPAGVTDTVCALERTTPIQTIPVSPPVISMTFGPNDSPLTGKEGQKLTSSMIKERLRKEIENNVTLSLRGATESESIDVQGRGELQIGILIETMRREGFEMTVSPPMVLSITEDGVVKEPFEEVMVDLDLEHQGLVIDSMSNRKGNLVEFKEIGGRLRMIFHAPSRGLLGFRHQIMNATRGTANINSIFSHYDKVNPNDFYGMGQGKLISMETGKTTGFALMATQERGQLFVGVGEDVYEGMVIGESAKPGDMDVNPCKLKKLTNMRTTMAEEKVSLTPPKRYSLEEYIAYMDVDEVLEVTPKNVRLRKRILESGARARYNKANKNRANASK